MASTKSLRVRVESERCQGHNRCCSIAPELFEADDLGNARVKGDGRVLQNSRRKRNWPSPTVRNTP